MAVNPDEDTEFNDALRQYGILPPKPKAPESPTSPPSPSLSEELNNLTFEELRSKGDEAHDSDTEQYIASLQRQRLHDIVKERREARFGRIYPISREDYTREVTESSKQHENAELENGTGVVCFLYKDSHPASERTFGFLRVLAERYPQTKFVSIVGDKCIPNYPDRNLPTLLLYRKGNVVDNLVAWGANEKQPGTIHDLETLILALGIATVSQIPHDDRNQSEDSEDEDEASDRDHSYTAAARSTRPKPNRKKDESDSDFDI